MKNTIKITIASSFALFSVLATTSSITFAHGVDELFPRSAIASFCADKPLDSEHEVKMTLSDDNVVQGTIKCEAEYLNMSENNVDHNEASMNNHSSNNADHDDDNKNRSNSGMSNGSGMSNDNNDDHDDDNKNHSNSGMGNGSGMGNN